MDIQSEKPLVTFGIPAYNEAAFLSQSLDSLLKQSYPRLEILIADNGSTDATSDVARRYTALYPNIKYIQHPKNIGQSTNFNYLVSCASGKYFCWASAHDILENTFAQEAVYVLESDPSIVLAYPRTIFVWPDGSVISEDTRPFDIRRMKASRRFSEVMWRVDCNYVYGVWRLASMLESNLFQGFPAPDRVFLAEMAIKGPFAPMKTIRYGQMNRKQKQTEVEKRHRLMEYLKPHKTFTDAELMSKGFYAHTQRAFFRVMEDANLPWYTSMKLRYSIWLCGVMKNHMFPGADLLSHIVKKILPRPLLALLLRQMQ